MSAQFLVRFDDICPTMNWSVWEPVERALRANGVKPILAVVPDNQDPKLRCGRPRADFWDQMRRYRDEGWAIAWHGYQHVYETRDAGVIGVKPQSEFAGLDAGRQYQKLESAHRIFREQEIEPRVWVAPGHSFDYLTVKLLAEFGVRIISDGFFTRAVEDRGALWIPQQLWRFRPFSFGLWTVCCHINAWTERNIRDFAAALERFRGQINRCRTSPRAARRASRFPMLRLTGRCCRRCAPERACCGVRPDAPCAFCM